MEEARGENSAGDGKRRHEFMGKAGRSRAGGSRPGNRRSRTWTIFESVRGSSFSDFSISSIDQTPGEVLMIGVPKDRSGISVRNTGPAWGDRWRPGRGAFAPGVNQVPLK